MQCAFVLNSLVLESIRTDTLTIIMLKYSPDFYNKDFLVTVTVSLVRSFSRDPWFPLPIAVTENRELVSISCQIFLWLHWRQEEKKSKSDRVSIFSWNILLFLHFLSLRSFNPTSHGGECRPYFCIANSLLLRAAKVTNPSYFSWESMQRILANFHRGIMHALKN